MLKQLSNNRPHYTYRQLIVPENVGSAAWLSKNYQLIDSIKGGIFVEMIGSPSSNDAMQDFIHNAMGLQKKDI